MRLSKKRYQKYFNWLVVSTLIWGVGGTWWYVCKVQYLCESNPPAVVTEKKPVEVKKEVVPQPVVEQPVVEQPVVEETPIAPVVEKPADTRILFLPDSSTFAADPSTYLDEVAEYAKATPAAVITATGYTTSLTSDEIDDSLALGTARAEAVKKELVSRGVTASQIVVKSDGEAEPVGDSSTAEGARQNRRVEVIIN